ncbi:MAG: HmuY family protein [Gemmatimonadota bacterium]
MTLDARDGDGWVYYSFERGATVDGTVDPDWDIAVQRFHFVTNGGAGYPGEAGAVAIPLSYDEVIEAPESGYSTTEGALHDAPSNPALERWYTYSFFAHTLEPKPETYVIRTSDGRFAKLGVISYYCPEATPGCFTFRYAYQGGGSSRLVE